MTVKEILAESRALLLQKENDTANLDTALLLAHVLGISRDQLYMDFQKVLSLPEKNDYTQAIARRLSGEPIAWILGKKEFWGLEYAVGPGVLCPRPDTETLVEAAIEQLDLIGKTGLVHDCCCGPGTIVLALAKERPEWEFSASDISLEAEHYFLKNNRALQQGKVRFSRSDLMEDKAGPFHLIVSNPPYLKTEETASRYDLNRREPALALDGGKDGLEIIRRFVPQAAQRLFPGGRLLMEADPRQMPDLLSLLKNNAFTHRTMRRDLGNRNRVIMGIYMGES